jgi:uncharacterized membrane protein
MFIVLLANAAIVGFFIGTGNFGLAVFNVAAGALNAFNVYQRLTN